MVRPLEIKAVAAILTSTQDYESVEECAEAVIRQLDADRASRTSYVFVMQFGTSKPVYYVGVGPYPTQLSAKKAGLSHPSAGMANFGAVVPMVSPDKLSILLEQIDLPPERRRMTAKAQAEADKDFWRRNREIQNHERTAVIADKGGVKIVKVQKVKDLR